jgi:asparagine synthase (glutamine-hydrolysing)
LSKLARTKVKVAICGDGGDEVFLGYAWYWRHWRRGYLARLKQMIVSSPFQDYFRAIQTFQPSHRQRLWNGRTPTARSVDGEEYAGLGSGNVLAINTFDLNVYLPGQLLVKADRAGMMNSLELRSPLLDHRLVEFAFNLPLHYKTDRHRGKLILKELLAESMPRPFVDREKQGFGAPVAAWLQTICAPLVRDVLTGPSAAVYSLFDRQYIHEMVDEFYAGDQSHRLRIWALLCLEMWLGEHRTALA